VVVSGATIVEAGQRGSTLTCTTHSTKLVYALPITMKKVYPFLVEKESPSKRSDDERLMDRGLKKQSTR
jgi:hypothetical protein